MRSAAVIGAVPRDWCLFLDVDGTLVELADTPAEVRVDPLLPPLLDRLRIAAGGAVALVSGRTIADVDALLGTKDFPVAGQHGCERRSPNGEVETVAADCEQMRRGMRALAAHHPRLLLEDKGSGLALHYLNAPELGNELHAQVLRLLTPGLMVLHGRAVIEVKPTSHTKGTAIDAYMQQAPFAGRTPVFLGDDITDDDGFAAVREYGGLAIAVGPRVTSQWWLPGPSAVRVWLEELLNGTE